MTGNIEVSNLVCVSWSANAHTLKYHFVGKTEEEARQKLQDWLDNKKPSSIVTDDGEISVSAGRGQSNNGKIWMLSHKLQQRARVNPDEVDKYVSLGYVNGGPKTAFIKE